jgi:protein SEY1
VADLRKKFTGEGGTETYFRPAYHKRIPADGVSHYMDGIWVSYRPSLDAQKLTSPITQEQVQSNKDLDLPTQQELLAQFRCDEISTASLNVFNEEVRSVRKTVESGSVVDGLGKLMATWKTNALG